MIEYRIKLNENEKLIRISGKVPLPECADYSEIGDVLDRINESQMSYVYRTDETSLIAQNVCSYENPGEVNNIITSLLIDLQIALQTTGMLIKELSNEAL